MDGLRRLLPGGAENGYRSRSRSPDHADRRPRTQDPHQGAVYGALDLGTNNCRLLLATPSPDGFAVVDAFSRIVRLGEGASQTGRLSDAAMQRTIEALRVCANKLIWQKVTRRRLIATEACRAAENGLDFLERVRLETGLELEIIDRQTEAQLAVAGAEPLIDPAAQTRFDLRHRRRLDRTHVARVRGARLRDARLDFPAGRSRHPRRAFRRRRSERRELRADAHICAQPLEPFAARIGSVSPDHLLGTSGTVTTIAGVQMRLRRYDRSRVDGSWLTNSEIDDVVARLLAMSYEERAASPCIGRDRADLVLAGCAILDEIRNAFPASRLRVADRGLREGMLARLMKEDGAYGGDVCPSAHAVL